MSGFVSYRTIYDAVCPISRATLMQWVKDKKVASKKDGPSKSHGRTYCLSDVKQCWDALSDDLEGAE